jgi:hypothetical protein
MFRPVLLKRKKELTVPVLTLEEVTTGPKKERVQTGEKKKPVIFVLDPNVLHRPTLEYILAGLLDRVEIFWHSHFSRSFIKVGGIDGYVGPESIAFKKPALIISELEVVPLEAIPGGDEGYYGLEMLGNVRKAKLLKLVPLIVISSKNWLERIKKESREGPVKLKEEWGFVWNDLRVNTTITWNDLVNPENQAELFEIVSEIINTTSPKTAA